MSPASAAHVSPRPARSHSWTGVSSGRTAGSEADPSPAPPAPASPSKQRREAPARHSHAAAALYAAVSVALVVLLLHLSLFSARMDAAAGVADRSPQFLGCRAWGFGPSCGLWGVDCRPFETDWRAFRCPAGCAVDQSPALAVVGSGPYRADSRICRAAIHAGVIGAAGGCALYRFAGAADGFRASSAHGVAAAAFPSWFPKTLEFRAAASAHCADLSWAVLALALAALAGLALFPRLPPAAAFHALVAWGFFYVRLIGQPRTADYAAAAVRALGEVLLLLAACHLAFRLSAAHTLAAWPALPPRRRFALWGLCYLPPFHALLHLNSLAAAAPWLDVDLGGFEPTAATAATYVVLALGALALAALTAWFARQLHARGLARRLLRAYAALGALALLSWSLFPATSPHVHHSMLGALCLPLTRLPSRAAAAAQAAALGLLVQGYAAWGWASFLDSPPPHLAVPRPPAPPAVLAVSPSSVRVRWSALPGAAAYSLRLNAVEVYRGPEPWAAVDGLRPGLTYFVAVAAVADWGTDGRLGPAANFTTPAAH